MNNFIEGIQKQKENNNVLTGSIIDMQAYATLATQIFSQNATNSPDFDNACDCLRNLCNEIKIGVSKVEEIIPIKKSETEII